jgi:hypothetical protein
VHLTAVIDMLRNVDGTCRRALVHDIGPVGECRGEMRVSARVEETEAVADGETEFLAIDAGQRRDDVDRGMRNQRRVMIGQ